MAELAAKRENLSARERQIADAYSAGRSYREIAEQLFIAPATVRTHLGTIYRKLSVSTKIELLRALESTSAGAGAEPVRSRGSSSAATPASNAGKRQVTVLSAMLDGLSEIARSLDPEETAALVGTFRAIFTAAVVRHGGQVLGDRSADMSACFGVPASDETDAERAVQCALKVSDRLRQERGPDGAPLVTRIGLFTGPAMVGTSAEAGGLAGGASYLAAVLAREAKGGGILVCARTHAMLGGLFTFSDFGPVSLDSGPGLLRSFSVAGANPSETRFAALRGYRLTPLVGRDHEIGLLESLFERARGGEGQVALISGEPGIGKSRMVNALCDRLALTSMEMLIFQCSPHERTSPLHAVAQSLRHLADVERHDTAPARLDALAAVFGDALDEPERDRQLLAELALIRHDPSEGFEPLPPEKRRAATLALLDRFLCRRAAAGPLLVVFEDMHWADPTTVQWLQQIVELTETLSVLVIATARPEFVFQPSVGSKVSSLSLSRLSRSQVAQIVADQAGDRKMSITLVERIAERSEGIPLFAEELTRAILELGEGEDVVPPTLQASLMGRLDRLGAACEVAQAAAVIGRDFDRDLLAEIVPLGPRALEQALDALLASKLVLRRAGHQGALQFKHALVRDTAYDSMLRARREALHLALAEVLIARSDRGRDIPPELIAHHLVEGGRPSSSVPFWLVAARSALPRGAELEASQFVTAGLGAASQIEDAQARDAALCDLGILRYLAGYGRGNIDQLMDAVEAARRAAEALADRARLSRVLDAKSYLLASVGRTREAVEAGRECVAISENLPDDVEAFVGANMMLGRALYAAGQYREAVAQAEIVRDFLGDDVARGNVGSPLNQTISTRVWLTFMRAELGEHASAEADAAKAFELLPEVQARDHIGLWAALAFGRLRFLKGDHRSVISTLEPKLESCKHELPIYYPRLAMSLGASLVASGLSERGLAILEEAAESVRTRTFLFSRSLLLSQYAHARLMVDDAMGARSLAERAREVAMSAGEAGNHAWALLRLGETLVALGEDDEARAVLEAAVAAAAARGMAPLLRRAETLGGCGRRITSAT